ncbi:MAG: DUF1343 domain-containing protein, partial [Gammaproteobacteria bacterium]|nr:DUF1343 domain-containing protein [Gammaproteobacteria bacterium]
RLCHGVRVALTDRQALDAPALGVEIASALTRLYPEKFQTRRILGMVGARWVVAAIQRGEDPRLIAARWRRAVQDFEGLRRRYLLY